MWPGLLRDQAEGLCGGSRSGTRRALAADHSRGLGDLWALLLPHRGTSRGHCCHFALLFTFASRHVRCPRALVTNPIRAPLPRLHFRTPPPVLWLLTSSHFPHPVPSCLVSAPNVTSRSFPIPSLAPVLTAVPVPSPCPVRANTPVYAYVPTTQSGFCSQSQITCNSDYGTSLARGSFSFATGKWQTIWLLVMLNEVGTANGVVQ